MANGESMGGSSQPINEVAMNKVGELLEECDAGAVVVKFVLLVDAMDAEGGRFLYGFTAPGQKRWDSLGLLEYGGVLERQVVVRESDD